MFNNSGGMSYLCNFMLNLVKKIINVYEKN